MKDQLRKAGEFTLALGLSVMVVMVFANVVLRYGFDSGITYSEEVSRFIFVWITFLGAVLAFAQRAHIAMENVTARLSLRGKRIALVLSTLLMLACSVMMVIGAWNQTVINLYNFAPVSGIPKGAIYAAGVMAGVSFTGLLLRDLVRLLQGAPVDAFAQHSAAE